MLGTGREFQCWVGSFCRIGPALISIPVCGLLLVTLHQMHDGSREVYKADDMEMHYNDGKTVNLSWLAVLTSAVLGWASPFDWSCDVLRCPAFIQLCACISLVKSSSWNAVFAKNDQLIRTPGMWRDWDVAGPEPNYSLSCVSFNP